MLGERGEGQLADSGSDAGALGSTKDGVYDGPADTTFRASTATQVAAVRLDRRDVWDQLGAALPVCPVTLMDSSAWRVFRYKRLSKNVRQLMDDVDDLKFPLGDEGGDGLTSQRASIEVPTRLSVSSMSGAMVLWNVVYQVPASVSTSIRFENGLRSSAYDVGSSLERLIAAVVSRAERTWVSLSLSVLDMNSCYLAVLKCVRSILWGDGLGSKARLEYT